MASLKDVEQVADDLSNLVDQLRKEIRDSASFDKLVTLADEISEHADEAAGTFSTINEALTGRLKELKGQQLYRLDRNTSYGGLDSVFRGTVDAALIAEQWDPLVRVAASLRNRTAPAHVVLDWLVASSSSDRLAKALTMLGRVLKTIDARVAAARLAHAIGRDGAEP